MAFKLADLFVEITGQRAGLDSILRSVQATLASANRKIGAGLTTALKAGAVAGAAGVAAAAAGISKAVSASSDLNEAVSKAEVVFGQFFSAVIDDAQKMADAYGVPKQQFVDAAASVGLIAKASGLSQEAAAGLGSQFAQLAGDAASFYNVDLDTALSAIRSGLVGEAEPMRAFGVLLSEQAVKTEAARLGIAALGSELTEGQKVQARASLIVKGLSDAQGDLARTSASTSNQTREVWGRLTNAAVELGRQVEPVWNGILTAANTALSSITGWLNSNQDTMAGWASSISGYLSVAGVIWRNLGSVARIAGLALTQSIINAGEWIAWLPTVAGTALGWFASEWPRTIYDVFNASFKIIQNVFTNIRDLFDATFSYIMDPSQGFNFQFTPLLDGFKATVSKFPDVAKPALTSLQDEIDAITSKMAENEINRASNKAKEAVAAVAGAAAGAGGAVAVKKEEKASKDKVEFSSASEYSRNIQRAILGGSEQTPKQQLEVQKQQLAAQVEANEALSKVAAGVSSLAGVGGLVAVAG